MSVDGRNNINDGSLVILAGGRSSRMGQNKADLIYRGKSFLDVQIDKGISLGMEDIIISGYNGRDCRFPVIPDRFLGKGPLAGLEACFRKAKGKFCLVLSVDVPLVPVSELEKLIDAYRQSDQRAVIVKAGEREQPLIGVYDVTLADQMMEEFLERKGSVFAFLRGAGYEVYQSDLDPELFVNINDPESYWKYCMAK